jgi:Zn-dependent peptidase ImmA (M78 family)
MLEHGQKEASEDKAAQFSEVLGFPVSFFYQAERYVGFGLSFVFHRKRSAARIGDLRRLQAEVNLRRINIARALRSVPIRTNAEFTSFDIDDYNGDAEQIAGLVRANWRIPLGPVSHLVRAIENAGAIVFKFSFGTTDVDAISQWPDDAPPMFFINSEAPADRIRYSLAHEIGHIVMHRSATGDIEAEADRFASELLMPANLIAAQLDGMNLKLAARLKPYWRVSMQALIRRARDLGCLPEPEYTRLFRRMGSLGLRKNEGIPIAPEEPTLVERVLGEFQRANHYNNAEMAAILDLQESDFDALYRPPPSTGLRLITD